MLGSHSSTFLGLLCKAERKLGKKAGTQQAASISLEEKAFQCVPPRLQGDAIQVAVDSFINALYR